MLKVNFYVNGNLVNPPNNYQDLALELSFDKDDPNYRGQVSTNVWELGLGERVTKDGAYVSNRYINRGLIGDVGVFEGIEFRIELDNNGVTEDVFNGYLDLSKAEINCDRISASATETGNIDWFNEVADSFNFEYLYNLPPLPQFKGKIGDEDMVPVPYLLSTVPDIYTAAITGVSLFTVLNQFYESVSSLIEKIPELIFPNFGNIVSLILVSIQLTLLQIASIILTIQLYRLLVPKVKYHGGMYVYTLCERAAAHVGLEFRSTILESDPYSKMLILPESFQQFQPVDNERKRFINFSKALIGVQDVLDFERVGFYRGTFGDLLRELKKLFNAKIIIEGDILRLEKRDFITSAVNYTIPDVDKSNIPYRLNFEDYYSYDNFKFTVDDNDSNCVQDYVGTEVQVFTTPKVVNEQKRVIGGAKREITINFARGIRRTKRNFIERMFKDVYDNMEPIINEIQRVRDIQKRQVRAIKKKLDKAKKVLSNLGIKFKNPKKPKEPNTRIDKFINDLRDVIFRKSNVLLLEKDFINVPKLLLMEADYYNWQDEAFVKLDTRNAQVINAVNFYDNFYDIDNFTGINPNQYKIWEVEVPFCIDDYNKIKSNKFVFDSEGKNAEIISAKWNIYRQTAVINYRVREKYTDNLKRDIIISNGK